MVKIVRSISSLIIVTVLILSVIILTLLSASCSNSETENAVNEKVDSQLLTQVNLKKEQLSDPNSDRLEMMQNMGMSVDNLEIHRIFINLYQELTTSQIDELESMGIILYLDSWIPPVGAHATGFLIADMPVDKLEALAVKDYVVGLETAERELQLQNGGRLKLE